MENDLINNVLHYFIKVYLVLSCELLIDVDSISRALLFIYTVECFFNLGNIT